MTYAHAITAIQRQHPTAIVQRLDSAGWQVMTGSTGADRTKPLGPIRPQLDAAVIAAAERLTAPEDQKG